MSRTIALRLDHVEPAGAWDDAAGRWEADAPLERAQSYLACLTID